MAEEHQREHTGRRRNEGARRDILRAAATLIRRDEPFTVDAIARTAGVGKQTIYRWWSSKEAVLAEAMTRHAKRIARVPDTGTVREDLAEFLAHTFIGASRPANRRTLRHVMSAAQQDPHLAEVVDGFTATRRNEMRELLERGKQRGELAAQADLDLLIDQCYGLLWYRLLVGHAPLDRGTARGLAHHVVEAASA